MNKPRWIARVAVLAVLALLGAACKSSTNSSSTGNTQTACKAQFGCVTYKPGEPIKLGTLLAIAGDVAFLGLDSQHGVSLAIDYLDGKLDGKPGTLLGHQVQLSNQDDGCSKEGGQAGGTKLAADPTIVAVIGTSCSSSALGVADRIMSDKGILIVSPSNTGAKLTQQGSHQAFYARTAPTDALQAQVVSDFAVNYLHVTKAATIHDESPYAEGLTTAFGQAFQQAGGTVTAAEAIQSSDKDFHSLLTTIASGGPQLIYYPDFDPACYLIAKQAKDIPQLSGVKLMGSDGCLETAYIQGGKQDVFGTYASGPNTSGFTGTFYTSQFLPAYQQQFGEKPSAQFHAHAFDAANMIFAAIRKVAIKGSDGTLTIPRLALKNAFFATKDFHGITGTLTCTPLGDCQPTGSYAVYQAPDFPCCKDNAKPVFQETKHLAGT